VEAFNATDGHLYILRGGPDAEFVIESPSPADRAILELLHTPRSRSDLATSLTDRGHDLAPGDLDATLAQLADLDLTEEHPRSYALPPDDALRFDRQLAYFADAAGGTDAAAQAQRRLARATVVVAGCGGLGSWTAAGLACAGVGRLVLVDDDTVELSNLNRQVLFRHADLGRRKVDAAANALQAFNPGLEIDRVSRRIASIRDITDLARGADLIIGTADHPPYEITRWMNAASIETGTPFTSAGQFPPHIRVGPLIRPGVTGCHACQEQTARENFPDYDALIAYRKARGGNAATIGPLSALVGSILSMDAVHLITGIETPATEGAALLVDARGMTVEREAIERRPDCPVCG
jgi:molybdopterin/thiamine biosynthesis adenylyltransferase